MRALAVALILTVTGCGPDRPPREEAVTPVHLPCQYVTDAGVLFGTVCS